jgi:hypothetical protein
MKTHLAGWDEASASEGKGSLHGAPNKLRTGDLRLVKSQRPHFLPKIRHSGIEAGF